MPRIENDSWNLTTSVGATATMVAAARAVASNRRYAIINDPFAGPLVRSVGIDFFTNVVRGTADFTGMGTRWVTDVFAVRTRYFDEFLSTAMKGDLRQAVIIASGLDSRGYRLPWPGGTILYEVDQPEVVQFKTKAMRELGVVPTVDLRTVGVDLREDWLKALVEKGFRPDRPTVWTVEGLLVGYLPSDAQDRLLDDITALSAAGSRMAADYLLGAPDKLSALMRAAGESWRQHGFTADFSDLFFNGERADVEENLQTRGWSVTPTPLRSLLHASGADDAANDLAGVDMAYISCARV